MALPAAALLRRRLEAAAPTVRRRQQQQQRLHHTTRAAASSSNQGPPEPSSSATPPLLSRLASGLRIGPSRSAVSTDSYGAGESTDGGGSGSGSSSGRGRSNSRGGSSAASSLDAFDAEAAAATSAEAARAAYLGRSLGFGFSAGGLLFPFYCGVVDELVQMNVIRDDTPLAGASAGSLIAACSRSGLSMATIIDACWELCADCRDNGTRFRLGPVLEGVLRELLPDDVAGALRGRAHVAVTRLLPEDGGPPLEARLVGDFLDRDDVIAALMTSCHIPLYMDGRLATKFRGSWHFDGGITDFLPSPPGAAHTVRVCCLPSRSLSALGPIDVAPDAFSDWPYSLREMLAMAFEPADQGMLEELVARGRADARAWAEATGVGALAAEDAAAAAAARAAAAAAAAAAGGNGSNGNGKGTEAAAAAAVAFARRVDGGSGSGIILP